MATATAEAETREQRLERRLRTDTPFYTENCIKIVTTSGGAPVPLRPKPAQLKLEDKIRAQEEAGLPVRVDILKARREGISTWAQGKITHRYTQRENHKALVVAHEGKAANGLLEMGMKMYDHLPDEWVGGLQLKPPIISRQKGHGITLGNPVRTQRHAGNRGLDSSYFVDLASELETGRALTFQDLHLSELAFWAHALEKLTALLQTVADEPGTMILRESTANGLNRWYKLCKAAWEGESEYEFLFLPWFDEPTYARRFATEEAREEFIASIGTGPWGADEPELVELLLASGHRWGAFGEEPIFELIPERLAWRRFAIVDKLASDLDKFKQEYPATPEEAFSATQKTIFAGVLISKAAQRVEEQPEPKRGIIEATATRKVKIRGKEIEVVDPAKGVKWTGVDDVENRRNRAWWNVWEGPQKGVTPREAAELSKAGKHVVPVPRGQYILTVDSAGNREDDEGELDNHAIQVINHRTLEQCAEHASRLAPDVIAEQAYIMGTAYNNALIAVELTGGYGINVIERLLRVFAYPNLYWRKLPGSSRDESSRKEAGWSTDTKTKPALEGHLMNLLREETHGIRSKRIISQMRTYVRDDKGKTGAEPGEHDDELVAYMIGQYLAFRTPLRPDHPRGAVVTSTRGRSIRGR